MKELNRLVEFAHLGYCTADLLSLNTRLGVFNDRPEFPAHVDALVCSFSTLGVESIGTHNAIPVSVNVNDIDVDRLTYSEDANNWLPLHYSPQAGQARPPMTFVAGRHRLAAVQKYVLSLEQTARAERNRLAEELLYLQIISRDDPERAERLAVYRAQMAEVVEKEHLAQTVREWGLSLYDEGMS